MKDKRDMSIDDLAIVIKKSFDHVDERFDKVEKRLDTLEAGQEDLKTKINFTVHKFELKELEYRVEKLEKKFAK